jgi:hypothetical protein
VWFCLSEVALTEKTIGDVYHLLEVVGVSVVAGVLVMISEAVPWHHPKKMQAAGESPSLSHDGRWQAPFNSCMGLECGGFILDDVCI